MVLRKRLGGMEEEDGAIQSKAMNDVDAERDRATSASVRHDDESLSPLSLRATVLLPTPALPQRCRRGREPLGLLPYCGVKLPRRGRQEGEDRSRS